MHYVEPYPAMQEFGTITTVSCFILFKVMDYIVVWCLQDITKTTVHTTIIDIIHIHKKKIQSTTGKVISRLIKET